MTKRTIALSLITATILVLNGCGETKTITTKESGKIKGIPQSMILGTCNDVNDNYICDKEESGQLDQKNKKQILIQLQDNSIKYNQGKFNLAFDRNVDEHELLGIFSKGPGRSDFQDFILNMDTDVSQKLTKGIFQAIKNNLNTLGSVGGTGTKAQQANIKAMAESLVTLGLNSLENDIAQECKDNEICKEEAYASIGSAVEIDKEEAYAIAMDIRKDDNPTTMDGLLKEFTCETGLIRTVQFYGVEDNFSTSNGIEEANPSAQISNNPSMIAYNNNVNAGFANYDGKRINRLFAEEVKNLPASIAKGHFYIGMDNHGSNDAITLGNLDNDTTTLDVLSRRINTNDADLLKVGSVYHKDMADINLNDGSSLKNYAYNHGGFDVYVQDDTHVDFIAVATCSKPNPIKEVENIINKFECSEKETLVKILGGKLDAFSPTTDSNPINPRSDLEVYRDANTVYPTVPVSYDYTAYDHHFIDTLNLGLTTSQTVTKAEFNIGYKVIGSSLHSNDALYLGDFMVNHSGGHFYDNVAPLEPRWNIFDINSYGYLAQHTNLEDLNNTFGTGNVLESMINKNYLDVYVQDDTAVDFTQLNLCVKDNCSEDAKEHNIDLSQLSSWTTVPNDTQVGSQASVWDNSLTWFNFTPESNGERTLKIPFCACGDTLVNIKSLKADNSAIIKLDATVVASQQAAGHAAMRSDSSGGNHEDGSLNISGNGDTNHVLRVDVKNISSVFGVGMEGSLSFQGYLGECK